MEQYLLLAKGARGRALVDLIQKVTSDPAVFAFGELLDNPSVKELEQSEFASAYQLLQLFAYSTWADYTAQSSSLPSLSDQQKLKLKLLTVVSIAESKKSIPYTELLTQLDLVNIRELEDLLITDCFHSGIIKGKLDQQRQCLEVHESIGRDVRQADIKPIISAVETWMKTCEDMVKALEERMAWVAAEVSNADASKEEAAKELQAAKTGLKTDMEVRAGLQEGMLLDDVPGPSVDLMDEDRIGFGSGRPKRRR